MGAANVLSNPGFESSGSWTTSTTNVDSCGPGSAVVQASNVAAHGGSYSGFTRANGHGEGKLIQTINQPVSIFQGVNNLFTGYVQWSGNVHRTSQFWVSSQEGHTVHYTINGTEATTGTDYYISLSLPAGSWQGWSQNFYNDWVTTAGFPSTDTITSVVLYSGQSLNQSDGPSCYSLTVNWDDLSFLASTIPTAPTSPVAVPNSAPGKIDVTWVLSDATDQPEVQWGTVSGTYTSNSGLLSAGTTSYTITGLTPGTLYYITIFEHNSAGNSPNSIEVSATATNIPNPPSTPSATIGNLTGQLVVSWFTPTTTTWPITNYNVGYSTTSGSGYTFVNNVGNVLTYTLSLTGGTEYFVVVQSVDSKGNVSNNSTEVFAPAREAPEAPTSLSATVDLIQSLQVNLAWSKGLDAIVVSWRLNYPTNQPKVLWGTTHTGPYTNNSGLLAAGTTYYEIQNLTPGTTYYVVVQECNGEGCSANSAEVNAVA